MPTLDDLMVHIDAGIKEAESWLRDNVARVELGIGTNEPFGRTERMYLYWSADFGAWRICYRMANDTGMGPLLDGPGAIRIHGASHIGDLVDFLVTSTAQLESAATVANRSLQNCLASLAER